MNNQSKMPMEASLIKIAHNVFKDRFMNKADAKEHSFSISKNIRLEGIRIDLAVLHKRTHMIGIIEIKPDLEEIISAIESQTSWMQFIAKNSGAYFVIVTDTKKYLLWTTESNKAIQIDTIDDVYKHVVIERVSLGKDKLKHISNQMYPILTEDPMMKSILGRSNVSNANQLEAHLEYSPFINRVMLSDSLEKEIFSSILNEPNKDTPIYRYISFPYFIEMLKENKFSVNSIVSMNDKTEVNYIEKYMDGGNVNDLLIKEDQIKNASERFISCFSSRGDDLTLWRLYTNNASGVCLEYTLKEQPLQLGTYIKKVKYADKPDGKDDVEKHKQIDTFRRIMQELLGRYQTTFRLRSLYVWKHFFKPSAFADESEIRLLIRNRKSESPKKWRIDSSSGIVTSFIEFRLFDNNLPICLKRVILGPRVPESEINKVQIEGLIKTLKTQMIKDHNTGSLTNLYDDDERKLLSKVKVERSKVQYYR